MVKVKVVLYRPVESHSDAREGRKPLSRGLTTLFRMRQDRDAKGVDALQGENVRLGAWGMIVSSPSGVRAEPRPKMDFMHT